MSAMQCPVCTLYLREGMSMKEHLDTHTKDRVIEALVSSEKKASNLASQSQMFANPYQTFIQAPYQMMMQQYAFQNQAAPVQATSTTNSFVSESSEKNIAVYNAPINYSPQTIISQPGTIIKIPPRPQSTKIIAVPLCNQFVNASAFATPLMQMPIRGAVNNVLTSNPALPNSNPQAVPTIMNCYPQIPLNVQPMQTTQAFNTPFNSGASVLASQSNLSTTTTQPNVSNASFNVPNQGGNSSLQNFPSTSSTITQPTQVTTVNIEKEVPTSRVSTVEENSSASTQPVAESNNLSIEYPNEVSGAAYEEIKEETGFRNLEEEEFEFFEETEIFDSETAEHLLPDVELQGDNLKQSFNDNKQRSSESTEKSVEPPSEQLPQSKSIPAQELDVSEESTGKSSSKNDKDSVVKDEVDEVGGISNFSFDDSTNMDTNDLADCDSHFEDDESTLVSDDIALGYENKSFPASPTLDDYESSPGEDGVCLESPIKLEECLKAEVDLDLSQSPFSTSSGDCSNSDDYFNASLISNNIVEVRPELFRKEGLSVTCVPRQEVPTSNEGVQKDSELKRKLDEIDTEESPSNKKAKHASREIENYVKDFKNWTLPTHATEGNALYQIQNVLLKMVSFNDVMLDVHILSIPDIENKDDNLNIVDLFVKNEELEQMMIPSKTKGPTDNKPNLYDLFSLKGQKNNAGLASNQASQTAETSNTSESTSLLTVIQQSPRSEPPPPYHAKTEVPCTTTSSNTYGTHASSYKSENISDCHSAPNSTNKRAQQTFPGRRDLSSEVNYKSSVGGEILSSHSGILPDYPICNMKSDRQNSILPVDYDSDDAAPRWLFRGINALPTAVEDDRISCASPKTLLNLDHQTSFQTFGPDDSRSTSLNMQTDEMMPPRGELSGQESLESSAWGYQDDHGSSNFRQWEESEPDIVNSNSFKIKTEKMDQIPKLGPIQVKSEKIKIEDETTEPISDDSRKKHACIYCNKVFIGWKLRKYHMKTEHPELFNEPESTSKLIEKVQTATSSLPFEASSSVVSCSSCPMKFDNSVSYGAHFQQAHAPVLGQPSLKTKNRQCSTCNQSFDKLKLFQDHIRFVHPLECPLCKKTFLTKPNLTIHMRTHLKIKPYKCDKCEKSFVTAQKLSDHKNTHTGNAPFPCNLCERNFKRYSNLAQHKKVIHLRKKKTKDFYCHCGEIFQSRGKLLWHQETHASAPKQCSFCVEKFTHTSSLTRHIRKNHDPCYLPDDRKEVENVTCDVCKIVVLKSTLKSHMRIHAKSKPFSCTVCKKSFYTKWNLGLHQWTHVSRTHMPFKCKSCNRGFYNSNEYQAHLRSHRNIRPYTCNYCGKKFIRKFNCIRHVREHEAKKKYTCTICNKSFHRSYYLTAHERVHNGERPFSCHICGKTSTTKSNHNKHVKTHHARENVNMEG